MRFPLTYRRSLFVFLLGLIAATTIYLLWPLSNEIEASKVGLSVQVLDRNGILLREIRPEGRGIPVALPEVAHHVPDVLVAIEDRQFYRHIGVSVRGIIRAVRDNITSQRIVSGGSTISMQVARMLKGHSSRSIGHKASEIMLALRLEVHLTKEEILTLWLNRAYFGNQAYGIESAARLYFDKSAQDITLSEAAYLIGLPQSPVSYDPYRFPENALKRHERVLKALLEAEHISSSDLDNLQRIPLQIIPGEQNFKAPHLVESLRPNPQLNQDIHTTIDIHLQEEVEALTKSHLKRLDSEYITNAAVVVLDNNKGEVLAYMGSADFWNEEHGGQNDGVLMLRQPGSALKPFTYAMALASSRYTSASILPDIETQIPEAGGAFSPQNYDQTYHGPVPFREALANSYNIPAIRLAREFGAEPLLQYLQELGFSSLDKPAEHYGAGLTLGNGEVRLLELALAYAVLARKGRAIKPVFEKRDNTDQFNQSAQDHIIQPEIASLITDILKDPEARAAAFGRYGPLELPFPCAVKTGTSKDYRDNWAIGYTPGHTVAVWVGNFDGSPMQRVSGVSGAGPLFKSIMLHLGSSGDFAMPESIESHLICPSSGLRPSAFCPLRKQEFFLKHTAPEDTCTTHRLVTVDIRTRLLADESTPEAFKKNEVFTVYPDIFHPWMRENHVPFPPEAAIALAQSQEVLPQIAYPASGMTFQLDPVLRKTYQRIKLEGIVPSELSQPEWWVNDSLEATNAVSHAWLLKPGLHNIILKAQKKDGSWVTSRPAIIKVVD